MTSPSQVLLKLLGVLLISISAFAYGGPVDGLDSDADGVWDWLDMCSHTAEGEPVDGEGCSVHDLCQCNYPWKNHGEYVSCITQTSRDFVKAGLITNKEKSDYVSEAAKRECDMRLGGLPNDTNYGDPHTPPVRQTNDTFEITFVVTGDPQFNEMFTWWGEDNGGDFIKDPLLRTQKTVGEMREHCQVADPECIGAVVVGDLTQSTDVQKIIAFRQLFEYGYPGEHGGSIYPSLHANDYTRFSWGYSLGYPMFPLIGNHDDPSEFPDSYVQKYITNLVGGRELYKFPIEKRVSGTAPHSYYKGNYAWEWGSVHFISLGLWAFYGGHEECTDATVDQTKIDWLKEYLAAVGTEKAIVLFQHFGWDRSTFSQHCDPLVYEWWSKVNAAQLVNVLCNRDSSDEPCGTEAKPRYNVIGIFSGHSHEVKYEEICAERNTENKCVVHFDNYIVNDAGPSDNGGTGYTMVHLNLWPDDAKYTRRSVNQMTVTNHDLTDFDVHVEYLPHEKNNTQFTKTTRSTHTKTGITSGFTTWDQGEPNGGRNENCATFKANGRFNDLKCHTHLRYVCRETDPVNPLISKLYLLPTEKAGAWHHGEFLCEDSNKDWVFSLPKSLEEQAYLMQLIIDSPDSSSPVWVNYSDQPEEGHWIVYPQDYFYFRSGQPDDGYWLFEDKGHGEDCAVINKDGQLDDRRCENEIHSYVCKDHDGWYIHPEKGMWKQAFDDDKCGEHGFLFPADRHEYQRMFNDLQPDLDEFGSAWISLNDINEETNWLNLDRKNKCWGLNDHGQADLPSETFRQITTGIQFSCGIRLDGTVQCWGDNSFGQTDAPSGTFLQISTGLFHTCGVRSDKTVACWGVYYYNDHGQADPPDGEFHQVSAGNYHTCGILNDDTLTCWGLDDSGQTDAPSGTFRQVSAGNDFSCGVHEEPQFEGYWKLDKDSADSSANGYDGTLGNSPTWSKDTPKSKFHNSNSLLFDRADHDYVTIPDTIHIDNLSQLSLSTWVKLNSTPSTDDSWTSMRFITLGNEKAVLRYVDFDGTDELQFYMKIDGVFHSLLVDIPWASGAWYHVAGTYDGSRMRLYLNGVEKSNKKVSGSVDTGNGVLLSHSGGGSLDGWLDEVQIYDYALSPRDVEAMAAGKQHGDTGVLACWGRDHSGLLDAPSGVFRQIDAGSDHTCGVRNDGTLACWGINEYGELDAPSGSYLQTNAGSGSSCGLRAFTPSEGYWNLDEGSGTIAADFSANSTDGTLGNSPTWSSDTAPTNFDNSNSLLFDRADSDYVTITGTTNIDNLSQLSLSTWVKLNSLPSEAKSTTYMRFITLGNDKAALRYVDIDGTGTLEFYMNIAGSSGTHYHYIFVGLLWEIGTWTHVAGTYDGHTMRVYQDGVELKAIDASGTAAAGNGVTLSHSGVESLDGLLDDVRIFNRALSRSDIQALAAGDHPGSGTLACWGRNNFGQLDAPSGTWDQVSTGGYHSCSVDSFIHPWEDDFAAGRKYNEDADCAELYTYLEDGKQTGKFYDRSCDVALDHYACRSLETGDWKITPAADEGSQWKWGFERCEAEFGGNLYPDYRFDAPITEADNERLIDLIWNQLGEHARVWVNYSDASIEGLWRHEYWENWFNQADWPYDAFGEGHCAWRKMGYPDDYGTADCDLELTVYCVGVGSTQPWPVGNFSWLEGNVRCRHSGGMMWAPPTNNSTYPLYSSIYWIRFSDQGHEGHWEDWHYGD
jgi:hypothetical protein